MVNLKFHLIRIFYEVSVNIYSIISCLKCTVNSKFRLNSKQNLANEWLRVNRARPVACSIWNQKYLPVLRNFYCTTRSAQLLSRLQKELTPHQLARGKLSVQILREKRNCSNWLILTSLPITHFTHV